MTVLDLARVYRIEEVWGEFARIADPGDLIQVPEKSATDDGIPKSGEQWEVDQERGGFVAIPNPDGRIALVPLSDEEEDDDGQEGERS